MADKLILTGVSNYKKPRQEFADKLAAATEEEYLKIAEQFIWLSAYASNNRRSDYHWQHDACRDEADRRGKPELYRQAYRNTWGDT